ncbi:MAG: hypothetical protein ACREMU_12975, partial [Gemmatimonadaceae bacterium]
MSHELLPSWLRRHAAAGMITMLAAALALVGSGTVVVRRAEAAPTRILLINHNVCIALTASVCDLTTASGRASVAGIVPLATLATDSAKQISPDANTGGETIIVTVDDPSATSTVALNGRG